MLVLVLVGVLLLVGVMLIPHVHLMMLVRMLLLPHVHPGVLKRGHFASRSRSSPMRIERAVGSVRELPAKRRQVATDALEKRVTRCTRVDKVCLDQSAEVVLDVFDESSGILFQTRVQPFISIGVGAGIRQLTPLSGCRVLVARLSQNDRRFGMSSRDTRLRRTISRTSGERHRHHICICATLD
jgi:hypothetical protein